MFSSLGLRARLVLLVLAAVAPVVVLLLVSAFDARDAALQRAQAELRARAELAAAHQERLIDRTEHLLETLAGAPSSSQGAVARGGCAAEPAALLRQHPPQVALGVVALDGTVLCQAQATGHEAARPDAALVQRVHERARLVAGRSAPAAADDAPPRRHLLIGLPAYASDGRVRAVAYAALDPAALARSLAAVPTIDGLVFAIRDDSGVMASFPERADPGGPAWIEATSQVQGVDGLPWQVVARLPRDQVLARPAQAHALRLAVLVVAALLGAALAWWLGGRLIVAPAREMLRVAHQVGAGDTQARVTLRGPLQRGELARLAHALNQMAASIGTRQQQLDDTLQQAAKDHSLLESMVNSMREGVIAVDTQGQLLLYNVAAARFFPVESSRTDLRGWRQWFDLLTPDTLRPVPEADRPLNRALRGESLDSYEVLIRVEDAPDRVVSCNIRPLRDAAGQLLGGLAVFTDVTERRAADALRRDQELVLERMAAGAPLADALASAALLVERHAPGSLCTVLLREGEHLRFGAAPSLPASFAQRVAQVPIGAGGGVCGAAAQVGHPVVVVDIATDPLMEAWRGAAAEFGLRACWSTPVLASDGALLGTFAIYHREPHRPGEQDYLLAETATRLARIAIESSQAREALRLSEARFRELAATVQDLFYVRDAASGVLLYVSPASVRLWGRSVGDVLAQPQAFIETVHPDDRALVRHDFERQDSGEATDREYRVLHPDGTLRWVRDMAWPVRGDGGAVERIVGSLRDVTERKLAEQRLDWSSRSLQMLSRCNAALVRAQDEPQLLLDICRLAVQIGGYRLAWVGFAQDDARRSLHPAAHAGEERGYLDEISLTWRDDDPSGQGPAGRAVREGQAVVCEDITRADSGFFWQEAALRRGLRSLICLPLREGGHTFGILSLYGAEVLPVAPDEVRLLQELADNLAFGIDNLRSRAARREAEARARQQASLLDKASDAILVRDLQGHVRYWNQGAQRLYGWTAAEAVGRPVLSLLYRRREGFAAAMREVLAHGEWTGELDQFAKDGTPLVIEARWTLVRDEQGEPHSVLCINSDIRERRRARQQVLALNAGLEQRVRERTAQLELANHELEAFSYSVAHDLRSPLAAIDGFSHALDRSLRAGGGPRDTHYLDRIRSGVQRMGEMIDALLALAQLSRASLHWEAVDLGAVAQSVVDALRERDPQRQVSTVIDSPLVAHGDAALLKLVMENLLGNAWKFTAPVDGARIEVGQRKQADGTVAYFVRDNGVGFDMARADKLFGVFQRLHAASDFPGTGLGLANVQRIVQRHGGRVWAEATPGLGACFQFTLGEPPVDAAAAPPAGPAK